ncbi:MAG TPA: hypothetical protein VGR96_07145 [Acidobacteriaceae bacterium]|nr:hypothetical protein [Acidobacteriaceae bacterium]
MDYHCRYREDGTCEVICTRCFLTLGVADGLASVREIEASHICAGRSPLPLNGLDSPVFSARQGPASAHSACASSRSVGEQSISLLLLYFLSLTGVLYATPTIVEIVLIRHISPWFAGIVLGDALGSALLYGVFKMRRSAILLYLVLTVIESCLYGFQIVSADALPWITDLVPAVVVAYKLTRMQADRSRTCLPRHP